MWQGADLARVTALAAAVLLGHLAAGARRADARRPARARARR
jgi:hypothetical protein